MPVNERELTGRATDELLREIDESLAHSREVIARVNKVIAQINEVRAQRHANFRRASGTQKWVN